MGFASACGGNPSLARREPDEYVGCATDEAWALFDDVPAIIDDAQAPRLVSAVSGAMLASTPVDLTWQATPTSTGAPMGDIASSCPQWSLGYTTLHLPPVSGTLYDLQLSSGGEVKHRVLTSLQKWTASADTWRRLAGGTLEVRLARIVVLDNDRKEGPYTAALAPSVTIAR